MEATAALSQCRRYRYALWRKWADGPQVLFVMLNPSTADESANDPTIRRCIGFAKTWGFGSLAVGNLFALRTPSPSQLMQSPEPIGNENDQWLQKLQGSAALTVAAWGNNGTYQGRGSSVAKQLVLPHTLGVTKLSQPRHPLYVSSATQPQEWV
jgi:hypothetical protein